MTTNIYADTHAPSCDVPEPSRLTARGPSAPLATRIDLRALAVHALRLPSDARNQVAELITQLAGDDTYLIALADALRDSALMKPHAPRVQN